MDRIRMQTLKVRRDQHPSSQVVGTFLLAGMVGMLALIAGCKVPKMSQSDIPVPPATLNTAVLEEENIRYQSPDQDPVKPQGIQSLLDLDPTSQSVDSPPTTSQQQRVAEVVFRGNTTIQDHQLKRAMRTRPDRFFDPDRLQQDVNDLWKMPEIQRVNGPFLSHTDEGVVVTIEVEERPLITQVEFIGNRGIPDRTLKKETGLEDGKAINSHQIRMAKTRLEELYREKGYPRTQVEIMEGSEEGDSRVVFLIHEDEKQRIWRVDFEGNTIATDARLKNFIKSKPGILKVFGGLVKRDEIEQDIERLTAYYRSLGFFGARVGREVSESNDGRWLTLRFIINEGPRYRVRNVSFVGNSAYSTEQLDSLVGLKPNDDESPEFNVAKMNQDVVALRDLYGSQGFIFAKVEAEPRFLEEPGQLDLVYKIDEGQQYYAGNINVHYVGGGAITKREVVLNRLSVRTGQLIDTREVKNSERRLQGSQVFATGQQGGAPPRIVVRPPELKATPQRMATAPRSAGQGSHFR